MKLKSALALTVSAALLIGATPVRKPIAPIDGALLADARNGADWASYGRTYSEDHFSPLAEITTGNVRSLGLAWAYDIDVPLRADSQPLAADGVLYIATGLSVVQAIDAATGKQLWRFDPAIAETMSRSKMLPSWGIRGLALWKDRVLVAAQDGHLMALDRKTGALVWKVQTLDEKMDRYGEATITGAPRVFNGKVVIGFAGAERWARGAVSCYDIATGKLVWRFYTVPGNPADGPDGAASDEVMPMAARTWSGEWWKHGGGGTVWNAMTYDPELNRVYIGVGNGGPWNWKIRNPAGGDALFLASIVALDADTGKYAWHYQQNPNEAWDYNAVMDMPMATLTIDGKPRKVLMQAPKNGFYYVLDRETGKLISAEAIGKVTWTTGIDLVTGRPREVPGSRYENGPVVGWPGTWGTHNWQPMSFSPITGYAYIPTIHQADYYSDEGIDPKAWQRRKDGLNLGMNLAGVAGAKAPVAFPVDEFGSTLQAWDAVHQRRVWQVPTPGIVNGGTMATAGGLVFQGHIDGTFNAYDARNGEKLWSFPAGVSVLGAPISYRVNGRQYISVLTAPPSGSAAAALPQQSKFGWRYGEHPPRVLTFVIGGKAKMPPLAPSHPAVPHPAGDMAVDPKRAAAGALAFSRHGCSGCHGMGAIASGGAPDLRASAIPLDAAAFSAVVKDGILLTRGMPKYGEIDEADLENIRHFLRTVPNPKGNLVAGERAH